MILLFNKNKELINEFSPNELLLAEDELKLNGQWIANISYPFVYHNKLFDYFGYFYNDNFYMYKIIQVKNDNGKIYLKGIHIFFDEMKGLIVRDKKPTNKTVQQVCDDAFKDIDWKFISSATNNITTSFYHISYLDAFYKTIKNSNAEFYLEIKLSGGKISDKRVIIKDNISKNYGKWFEYGSNLVSVVAEENHSNVFTAFIGRGKGEETENGGFGRKIKFDNILWSKSKGDPINKPLGQDYVEIEEATKLFGYENNKPKIAVIDFDDIEDKEKLLLETYNYALKNTRPKLLLSAKAHSNERIDIGEIVTIIRDDLNIRYQTKVISLRRNLLNDTKEFEIGENITKSQVQRLKENEAKQENQINNIVSILDDTLSKIKKDYFAEDAHTYNLKANNEYKLPSGIYSFNKPINENPTKVVYVGAGKVLIADEKGSDGAWKWKTALDGNGIYGNEIVTGSITANKLSSDVGQSLDLSSNKSITQRVESSVTNSLERYLRENKKAFNSVIYAETTPTETDKLWYDTKNNKLMRYDSLTSEWIELSNDEVERRMTEIRQEFETYQSLINGRIEQSVSRKDFENFENESKRLLSENRTKITQTEREITQTFTTIQNIEKNLNSTDSELKKITAVIKSGTINGVPYTDWISDSSSNYKVRVSADGIAMMYGDNEQMRLQNGIVRASELHVTSKIGFGNHIAQKYQDEYTIFAWTGGIDG